MTQTSGVPANPATNPPENNQTPPAPTSWKDTLPDDIKADPSLKSIEDVSNLAKSYVHAQRMIGKDKIVVPSQFATDDEWRGVYQKLGLPDSPDKYELKLPEDIKEEEKVQYNQLKEFAIKNHILPKQLQATMDYFNNIHAEQSKMAEARQSQEFEAQVGSLKKEWGENYDANLQRARVAVEQIGGKEFKEYLHNSGLGNDINLVKFMAKVSNLLKEDAFKGEAATSGNKAPADYRTEINSILGDRNHAYHNKLHPSHKDAVQYVAGLYEKMQPQ